MWRVGREATSAEGLGIPGFCGRSPSCDSRFWSVMAGLPVSAPELQRGYASGVLAQSPRGDTKTPRPGRPVAAVLSGAGPEAPPQLALSEDVPEGWAAPNGGGPLDDRVEPVVLAGSGVGEEARDDRVEELLVHEAVCEVPAGDPEETHHQRPHHRRESGREAEDERDADRDLAEHDEEVDRGHEVRVGRERDPEPVRRVDDRLRCGINARCRSGGGELQEACRVEGLCGHFTKVQDLVEAGVQEPGTERDPEDGKSLSEIASCIHDSTPVCFRIRHPWRFFVLSNRTVGLAMDTEGVPSGPDSRTGAGRMDATRIERRGPATTR